MGAISFNGSIYPAGSTQASDSIYDNTHTGLPASVQGALDKTTGNISSLGTVELTATAAHAHAVKSTFLWIGQLVKATVAIAVGDTIAIGTNVENTDICSVLDELNSNLKWKLLSVSNNAQWANAVASYDELKIYTRKTNGGVEYTFNIITNYLSSTVKSFQNGTSFTPTVYYGASINVTNTTFNSGQIYELGEGVIIGLTDLTIYGR